MARRKQDDTPRVGLAAFAEYLSATGSGRIDCVRKQIQTYSGDYRPGAAFYKDFIDALIDGRRTGADSLRLALCVSQQHVQARADHYSDLTAHWLAMNDWHLPPLSVGRTNWSVDRLTVGIAPELAVQREDGTVIVVKVWPYAEEPSSDAIKAMHRLLTIEMTKLYNGATPGVLDIRRERMHLPTKRRLKAGFDEMLVNEANGMGALWRSLAASA